MPQLEFQFPEDGLPQHFPPAWGAVPEQQIKGLIILEGGNPKVVDATWWYACEEEGNTLRPNMAKQTLKGNINFSRYPSTSSSQRHHIIINIGSDGMKFINAFTVIGCVACVGIGAQFLQRILTPTTSSMKRPPWY
jgi:hypothetical protein